MKLKLGDKIEMLVEKEKYTIKGKVIDINTLENTFAIEWYDLKPPFNKQQVIHYGAADEKRYIKHVINDNTKSIW